MAETIVVRIRVQRVGVVWLLSHSRSYVQTVRQKFLRFCSS